MHEAAPIHDCRNAFEVEGHGREKSARLVVVLTTLMMVGELIAGYATHSMALTADGWHMATHAGALGLSAGAYWFARSRARDRSFVFGTGKVHALAGYTSAIALTCVAISMIIESVQRFVHPATIHFREALPVAVLGLVVNLASIKLLGGHDGHHHDDADGHHDHHDDHDHHDHDENHRAAYMHVVADALTSILAIAALLLGSYFGWTVLDPMMGIVGGVVVMKWGIGLCRSAGRQLVDATTYVELENETRRRLEAIDDVRVADLHIWDMAPGLRGCLVALHASRPRETAFYRRAIETETHFAHLTVEVHQCVHEHENAAA